jgi:hypothetical protein
VNDIPPFVIAELDCSDEVFSGCEALEVKTIHLQEVNEWLWRVQPLIEQESDQSFSLFLYEADVNGEKTSTTAFWRYDFMVSIGVPSDPLGIIEENLGEIIAGIFTVLVALIGAGYFARRRFPKAIENADEKSNDRAQDIDFDEESNTLPKARILLVLPFLVEKGWLKQN